MLGARLLLLFWKSKKKWFCISGSSIENHPIGEHVCPLALDLDGIVCASRHVYKCGWIPLFSKCTPVHSADLWQQCLWFFSRLCERCRLCVRFHSVGMQQASHSIAGHVSSMIANRLPPQSSVWKINGMLFVFTLSHTDSHCHPQTLESFWAMQFV